MARITKAQQAERDEAIATLRGMLKPGDTLYTKLEHVSRSGMMRHISVYFGAGRDDIRNVTFYVARAMGEKRAENGGIKMGGAGMDMGFALVYAISRTLYQGNFTCIGEGCPSNDHVNDRERNYSPDRQHSDGGYALNHRWL